MIYEASGAGAARARGQRRGWDSAVVVTAAQSHPRCCSSSWAEPDA